MKRIEELGISPAPWNVLRNGEIVSQEGFIFGIKKSDFGCRVVFTTEADASLIAAAPELYEALREAIVEMCHDCPNRSAYPKYGCKDQACKCFPAKWRAALAKAAGEGATK